MYLQALFTNTKNKPERFVRIGDSVYSIDPHPSLPGFYWVEKQKDVLPKDYSSELDFDPTMNF
jgi:hypothetical protein